MKHYKTLLFLFSLFLCLSLGYVQGVYAELTTNKQLFLYNFKNLCSVHSEHAYYKTIGKTVSGADIYAFYIGHGATRVIIQGAIHGDEYYSSHALYYLAKWILETNTNETQSILKRLTVILIPMVNFDKWAITRKNMHSVDLNRNFKWNWGTTGSSDPNAYDYRGPYALSEPESRTLHNFYFLIRPKVFLDLHDFGATVAKGDIRWQSGRNELEHQNFYNTYVQICSAHNVSYWAYRVSSNYGGFALSDAREYAGAVSFLAELNIDPPSESQVQGEIKDRLACFLITADQLYGKESSITDPQQWIDLASAILIIALIITVFRQVKP